MYAESLVDAAVEVIVYDWRRLQLHRSLMGYTNRAIRRIINTIRLYPGMRHVCAGIYLRPIEYSEDSQQGQ